MRAHVSYTQKLRSHVVIHMNYIHGIIVLTKILVYLGLISKATVGFPLCILLGVMRSLKMKTKVFRLNLKLLSLKHKLK